MRCGYLTGMFFVAALGLTLGCQKKEKKGDSGKVTVALENKTDASLLLDGQFTPTVFGIKLVSVRLLVDSADCTKSACPMVWSAKDCPASISESEQGGKKYEYLQSPGCAADAVKDYFDLAASSEEVNKNLNSQNQPILPGTYKYAIMTWAEGAAQEDALTFQTEDMEEAYIGDLTDVSGILSSAAAEPITIGDGESVEVNLAYDLANSVYDEKGQGEGQQEFCYTPEDETMTRCLVMPKFTLTFEKK